MDFWVAVKECIGVCGFPQAESNARKKLEDLVCGRSELRRKRAGTKAFEYHISVLPPEVRAELLAGRGLIETSSGLITLPQEPERVAAARHQRRCCCESQYCRSGGRSRCRYACPSD